MTRSLTWIMQATQRSHIALAGAPLQAEDSTVVVVLQGVETVRAVDDLHQPTELGIEVERCGIEDASGGLRPLIPEGGALVAHGEEVRLEGGTLSEEAARWLSGLAAHMHPQNRVSDEGDRVRAIGERWTLDSDGVLSAFNQDPSVTLPRQALRSQARLGRAFRADGGPAVELIVDVQGSDIALGDLPEDFVAERSAVSVQKRLWLPVNPEQPPFRHRIRSRLKLAGRAPLDGDGDIRVLTSFETDSVWRYGPGAD